MRLEMGTFPVHDVVFGAATLCSGAPALTSSVTVTCSTRLRGRPSGVV